MNPPSGPPTAGAGGTDDAWLVIVDMQHVFADPGSPWYAPGTAELVADIARLAGGFPDRVVCTRFVAPDVPSGSWVDYYREWPWALRPPTDPIWELLVGVPDAPVVDATTFSKWGPDLSAATGGARRLVVCGVATDCCVLTTALGAADAGIVVHVVGDACTAVDGPTHDRTLELLAAYTPMIRVTSVDTELAGA